MHSFGLREELRALAKQKTNFFWRQNIRCPKTFGTFFFYLDLLLKSQIFWSILKDNLSNRIKNHSKLAVIVNL